MKKLSLTELKLLAVGEWLEFGFPDLIKEREWKNGEEVSFFCFVLFLFEWYYYLKTEHWRIDAFELWCWRSLLTVPWTSMRSNQRDPTELRHKIKLLSEQASMVCCLFSSSVQSLSHVRLYATHGLQHARPPVYHKLQEFTQTHVQWVHDTIQPSYPLLSPSPPPFNLSLSGSFQMSHFFASVGQSIGVLASASIFQMNIQDWSPLGWTGWISM